MLVFNTLFLNKQDEVLLATRRIVQPKNSVNAPKMRYKIQIFQVKKNPDTLLLQVTLIFASNLENWRQT